MIIEKPLPENTFAVYVGKDLEEYIHSNSLQQALTWARNTYGLRAYIKEKIQTRDITNETV